MNEAGKMAGAPILATMRPDNATPDKALPDKALPDKALKVLIVDDQAGMTKVIGATAAEFGFETREINDAMIATEAFIVFRPDILILDLIMPGKDGLDVLNEVLVIDPAVKVVLISGYGASYLKLGNAVSIFHRDAAVEVLHKPFRAGVLREILQRLVAA